VQEVYKDANIGGVSMSSQTLTMLSVGDIILGKTETESYFELAAPVLRSADVAVGQLEVPFTKRVINAYYLEVPTEIPAIPGCDPNNISAFSFAGFDVLTLAGNHIWDAGVPGIEDSIAGLRNHDIAFVGAGMNIDEARNHVVIERGGTRFGFLNYNCVGPKLTWATPDKPGCAYLHIITHYELDHPTPGSTLPRVYTFAEHVSLGAMVDDIEKLRPLCDVLVVAFHKGVGFVPVEIAWYERQISYAAIDAGADLILGHHAHILKGIEQYKGKAIFHGLGNFVVAMPPVQEGPMTWAFQQWGERMEDIFGGYNKPDPANPGYPWHTETAQTIIAKCTVDGGQISRVGYLPCLINKQGQPEVLKNDERGRQVFDYMDKITREAGLNARYEWAGDEVVVNIESHR
jgi:poly-gamma-glutamate capsule biosynthesis protein CapA/YwtB (metallophosphatase superfamily)